MASFNLLASGS